MCGRLSNLPSCTPSASHVCQCAGDFQTHCSGISSALLLYQELGATRHPCIPVALSSCCLVELLVCYLMATSAEMPEKPWHTLAGDDGADTAEPPTKMAKIDVSCELCHRKPEDPGFWIG